MLISIVLLPPFSAKHSARFHKVVLAIQYLEMCTKLELYPVATSLSFPGTSTTTGSDVTHSVSLL